MKTQTVKNIYVPTLQEAKQPLIASAVSAIYWCLRVGDKWASRRTIDEICADALRDAPDDIEFLCTDGSRYIPPDTSETLGWPDYDRVRAIMGAATNPTGWNPNRGTCEALQLMAACVFVAGPDLWRQSKYDHRRRAKVFNKGI